MGNEREGEKEGEEKMIGNRKRDITEKRQKKENGKKGVEEEE